MSSVPATRRRRPGSATIALAIAWIAVASLLTVEGLLRLPLPLPAKLATHLQSCYLGGPPSLRIHAHSPTLEIPMHVPGAQHRCGFGAYRWQHRGDEYGFRNPTHPQRAEVVLLGDSMIYGHGVQERETVAAHLRRTLGREVVNLGMTGASPVHYLAFLRNFALPLEPTTVVVFLFANDVTDLRASRTERQLARFVEGGEVPEMRVRPASQLTSELRPPATRFEDRWLSLRLLRYLAAPPPRSTDAMQDLTREQIAEVFQQRRARALAHCDELVRSAPTETAYLEAALVEMAASARAADVRILFAYLPGMMPQHDVCFPALLDGIADTHQLEIFRPQLLETSGLPLPGTRLPEDGHLSPAGHRLLAEQLTAYLDAHAHR